MGPLLIFGASGHGKVVAETAQAAGFGPVVFADDDTSKADTALVGLPVAAIGVAASLEWIRQHDARVVVAIGRNHIRARVLVSFAEARVPIATVVHPDAHVSPSASLGPGTVVFAGAIVQADAQIGANVILNSGCSVDHDGVIGDHVHLCPGVHLGGDVTVDAGTQVGVGTSVIQGRRIGPGTVVGAGSAVVRDLPGGVVAYGTPARVQRSLSSEEAP